MAPVFSPELHRSPLAFPTGRPVSSWSKVLQGRQTEESQSRAAGSCQAGEPVPVALTPSSLALAWFLGTQTGLMSFWAAESSISRKAKLLESSGSEAWAEGGLSQNSCLPILGPLPSVLTERFPCILSRGAPG